MIESEDDAYKGNINILMMNVPDEIRTALKELIQSQGNMKMVGEASDPIHLLLTVNDTQADVVIMGDTPSDRVPGICTHLLAEYPDLLVLTLSTQQQRAFLYQRKITRDELLDASPEGLITKISEAFSSRLS
jgi:DNA-binding NarL/FixJ family response regulator